MTKTLEIKCTDYAILADWYEGLQHFLGGAAADLMGDFTISGPTVTQFDARGDITGIMKKIKGEIS